MWPALVTETTRFQRCLETQRETVAMAGTVLQGQGAIYMEPLLENAIRRWRTCWHNQLFENLDAEEVYDRFHDLLFLSTTMRVPAPLDLERQDTRCGHNNFPALLPVSEAFDLRIPVVVSRRVLFVRNENDEYVVAASPPVHSAVYVQCHKPAELVATTDVHRAQMRDEVLAWFAILLGHNNDTNVCVYISHSYGCFCTRCGIKPTHQIFKNLACHSV